MVLIWHSQYVQKKQKNIAIALQKKIKMLAIMQTDQVCNFSHRHDMQQVTPSIWRLVTSTAPFDFAYIYSSGL